jgi:hypothetical protein
MMHSFLSSTTETTKTCWWFVPAGGEHLTNVFGKDAQITVTPKRDYKYRVISERKKMAQIVAARINQIDYGNFKNSVGSEGLHELYARFWNLHHQFQR